MVYVRTVRTSSEAVAVQVVWKSRRGSRDIEHLGSAHTDAEVQVFKAVAAQRIADGQDELPFGVPAKQEPRGRDAPFDRLRAHLRRPRVTACIQPSAPKRNSERHRGESEAEVFDGNIPGSPQSENRPRVVDHDRSRELGEPAIHRNLEGKDDHHRPPVLRRAEDP